jgi:tRNA nucleotidyltransferase (CCA-adding enzyme)
MGLKTRRADGRSASREAIMANLASAQTAEVVRKTPVSSLGWEHFAHGADVGVRGYGPGLEEAFEQAALALAAVVTDAPVTPKIAVTVVCEAPDNELLLVEWLDAIIYEMAARRMLFGRFSVTIRGRRLYGTAWGESIQPRHAPACEPKAATLTELKVFRDSAGRWTASCVVDV